jgi:hypothetical protein
VQHETAGIRMITVFIRYEIDPFQKEAYRARLRADAVGASNFAWAHEKRFILREERTFLQSVAGTVSRPSQLG